MDGTLNHRPLGALLALLLVTLFVYPTLFRAATTRFVSQAGGLFSGGTACNGQTAISVATFNGTAQGAGDLNWVCGVITSALFPSGSGGAGNVVTIKFDTGAGMSFAAVPTSGAIVLTSLSHYSIDGAGGACGFVGRSNVVCSNGYIKSTANGTGQANQIASVAVYAQNASDVEIKGLTIGPLYTHTSTSDLVLSPPGAVCTLFQGGDHFNIHNNTMHDAAWCIDGGSATGVVTVANNELYNVDHGVGNGGPNTANSIHDNHFHDFANWDTSNNSFHHDGIHLFGTTGSANTNATEYNNIFDGDPGFNWTSDIYNEGLDTGFQMYNNVAIVPATRQSCCGVLAFYGNGYTGVNNSAYNNTIIGAYVAGSGGCFGMQTQTNVTVENNSIYGCQGLISLDASTTFAAIDYNAYEDVGTDHGIDGSANTFSYHGSSFSSFTTWKTDCSCDAHSQFGTTAQFNQNLATGAIKTGSFLITNGLNLTGLSIPTLTTDACGTLRPNSAWDIGACQFTSSPPITTPPTNAPSMIY